MPLQEDLMQSRRLKELADVMSLHSFQSGTNFTTCDISQKPLDHAVQKDMRNVDHIPTIQNSMRLVKGEMSGTKKIIYDFRLISPPVETTPSNIGELKTSTDEYRFLQEKSRQKIRLMNPQVLADNLLEDIFVIIYSDAAQCTSASEVFVSTSIEQLGGYWKISITDKSKGVPSEQHANQIAKSKPGAIGISILRSLIEDRYHGHMNVKYRVPSTTFELWLPKIPSQLEKRAAAKRPQIKESAGVTSLRSKYRVAATS